MYTAVTAEHLRDFGTNRLTGIHAKMLMQYTRQIEDDHLCRDTFTLIPRRTIPLKMGRSLYIYKTLEVWKENVYSNLGRYFEDIIG